MATFSERNPNNLPVTLSSFIGREREILEIRRLLDSDRLLTLTGPGGCGKTRLAIEAAAGLTGKYVDGVWLVELASLSDPELVSQALATTLAVREKPGMSLNATLAEHLRSREILLVLDNCEHLISACAGLTEALLRACPALRILATSREMLGIPGELVWTVPTLSLPDSQPWRDPGSPRDAVDVYLRSEAVRLFVARATSVSHPFELNELNAPVVADICRQLDGIPLAIELAAARVRTLSVEQISGRLDDRFRLLTAGSRTAPPRQQTLEAALDWSYALLSEAERKVLQRLSVFAGGWTLEAAEVACGEDDGPRTTEDGRFDLLDLLTRLVDKSLVVVDKPGGEARYHLLETIRQYASEKLKESGDAEHARDRHLNYFLDWAEQGEPHLTAPEQLAWANRFEAEHDNLRAALEWSKTDPVSAGPGLRLAAASGRFWRLRSYLSEGRAHLLDALARAGTGGSLRLPRAQALARAANLAYLQTDYAAARSMCEESLALCRGLGQTGRAGVAAAVELLGEVSTEEGDYVSAPPLFEEALGIYRELQNSQGIGEVLMQLGWVAIRTGAYEQALARLEEMLALSRAAGHPTLQAFALSGLGEVAVRQSRYEDAARLLEESLAMWREHGDKWGLGTTLGSLGWVALRQGDFQRMRTRLDESLTMRMEIGDRGGIAWCLEKLAEASLIQAQSAPPALRLGNLQRAAQAYGAAAGLRAPLRSAIDPTDRPDYERNIAALREALGEEPFAQAWAGGGAMTLEQAVRVALSVPDAPVTDASVLPLREAKEKFGGLTAREREVATLIAQGRSNRDIAQAMVVGVKTVETYVTRILDKLGFNTRVQIATWAMDKGLKEPEKDDS